MKVFVIIALSITLFTNVNEIRTYVNKHDGVGVIAMFMHLIVNIIALVFVCIKM